MTRLQKLILDALDQLGPMNEHELQTACLIEPKQRGGFRSTLNMLYADALVEMLNIYQMSITTKGVHAIEADNIAHEAEFLRADHR